MRQCVEVGLLAGKHLSVEGSFVEANAAMESRIPREQLVEAAQVHHTVRQCLKEVNSGTVGYKPKKIRNFNNLQDAGGSQNPCK